MCDVLDMLSSGGFHLERDPDAYSVRHNGLAPALKEVLFDIMGICRLYNTDMSKRPLDLYRFQEATVSICYRLLGFRTLEESRRKSDIQSAYHIGLVILMLSILVQSNQSRAIKYELVALCLRDVLESGLDEIEDGLTFWLLILGGFWISGEEELGWAVSRLQRMASRLRITTWDEARSCLRRFPWIHAIHDKPGQKLWDQVRLVNA